MIFIFAIIGAFLAIIPGASFLLIPLELLMLYLIANKHEVFELGEFLAISAALITISGFLKGLASFLHSVPVLGQLANSLVAGGFILIVGWLAQQHYASKKAQQRDNTQGQRIP